MHQVFIDKKNLFWEVLFCSYVVHSWRKIKLLSLKEKLSSNNKKNELISAEVSFQKQKHWVKKLGQRHNSRVGNVGYCLRPQDGSGPLWTADKLVNMLFCNLNSSWNITVYSQRCSNMKTWLQPVLEGLQMLPRLLKGTEWSASGDTLILLHLKPLRAHWSQT